MTEFHCSKVKQTDLIKNLLLKSYFIRKSSTFSNKINFTSILQEKLIYLSLGDKFEVYLKNILRQINKKITISYIKDINFYNIY